MRCILCEELSFSIVCTKCKELFLTPEFFKRSLMSNFNVYSFYNFEAIKEIINTKYQFYGDRILNIIAKQSFGKFGKNFNYDTKVYAIPIDDHTRHQFSHTAILAKHLLSKNIKPIYNTLKATNIVKYAGKDLIFRKNNKRNFVYNGKKDIKVILVDDITTTGLTLLEAKKKLEEYGCEVLFALTLSDVSISQ